MQIAIVVVLYQQTPLEYIYKNQELSIIVVDNTPNRNLAINYRHITYLPLGDNYGIAKALNIGFSKAKELGAQWVLTMDQDSILPDDMIEKYCDFIKTHSQEKIGILSPLIQMYDGEYLKASSTYEEINEAITSGSMVNMSSFEDANGFKSELFIDAVDFEFCYNIRRYGYHIYRLNSVLMQHHLGNTKEYKLFGKHLFYVTNHSRLRRYYMTRNGLYLRQLYSPNKKYIIRELITYLKIILFEDDKLGKMRAIRFGKQDYRNGVMGKREDIV